MDEIRRLHGSGVEINYAAAEANHLNLVRAGAWHFGTWRQAVESAGIDYDKVARYQRWDKTRIVERIKQLHADGADLSWRAISTQIDPPLAAAALRANGFSSWRDAIAAAGLDIDSVARYRYWTRERVLDEIKVLREQGHALSSKVMQDDNQSLFCAGRRRFGSWDQALEAAGLDVAGIRMRRAPLKPRKQRSPNAKPVAGSVRSAAAAIVTTATPPSRGRVRRALATPSISLNGHSRGAENNGAGAKVGKPAARGKRAARPRTAA